jgi:plasmid stability protein
MASLTLKNVPEDLLERLRRRAERNRRSLMKEALYLLELGVETQGVGLRAGESTPVYGGGSGAEGLSPEQERESQLEAWQELCGQWESEESVAEELEALSAARTVGRVVDL